MDRAVNEMNSEPIDVFDRIRDACRTVADRATHVCIRTDRVEPFATALAAHGLQTPPIDDGQHVVAGEAETVAFFVTLDAINFGSGYFPHLTKRPGLSGYYTIASCLADRFRADGPIPAARLATIEPADCARLFGQEMASFPIRELMTLFARALNHLGRHVEDRFDGRFEALIDAADRSAAQLVGLLTVQPFFRDVPPYRDLTVPLYKRAQILASDLALALGGKGLGRFDDLDRQTIFADNLVPHVLRIDGLLEYTDGLASAIDRDELLPAGSAEEVEIRACAVHVVELLREALNRSGRPVTSRILDQILWHRGQSAEYKREKRHRTRTVFY
jgi:hypothetical protein